MTITATSFQQKLLKWFDQHGRKELPWQIAKTPYRVWVSEIMLQQTQVATVIPYFLKFMHAFPDITKLAHAHEDSVLHLWAGLGYYSRARNLHRAAKMVMSDFGGQFPGELEALQTLPGIGPSTAGAIRSIAFNQPAPILDGNVKRVLTRIHAITQPPSDKATEETLWKLAVAYTPKKRVADYTQAIMDLGATLCTRSKPNCPQCPFHKSCNAYALGIVDQVPAKKTTTRIPTREATFLIIKQGKRVLLHKRPSIGIWGGLFSVPEIAGVADSKDITRYCRQHLKLNVTALQPLTSFRHTFSHYHLTIHPILLTIKKPNSTIMEDDQQIWYNLSQPENVGLPKPVQSILRELT